MNAAPEGISETLAALDAAEIEYAHAAARRLGAIGIDTRISAVDPQSGEWYLGENFAFRPVASHRAPIGASAETLVQALNEHEELLSEIEAATGYATEFVDHGPLGFSAAALELARDDEPIGELVTRVPIEDAAPPKPIGFVALEATAARLSLPEAEALRQGDLVILSRGPWPLAIAAHGFEASELAFDPANGRLGPSFSQAEPAQDVMPMSDTNSMQTLSIPLTVRLPDVVLSPEELAGLASKGMVDLGPISDGLTVTLSVGGRAIGSGEVVRLGDRFGVLLEDPSEHSVQDAAAEGESETSAGRDEAENDDVRSAPVDAD